MNLKKLLALISMALLVVACPAEEEPVDNAHNEANENANNGEELDPPQYPLATCDDLDPEVCAFPWPSHQFLEPDDERATGYSLRFDDESLPSTNTGIHIDPSLLDHLDGYDLGVPIMAHFPDLDDSELPNEYEIEASMDDDALILLYEVTDSGLERIPYFAELDVLEDDARARTLFIRPAVILENDTRYVVAMRDLENTDGDAIKASEAFSKLVAGDTDDDPVLLHRQERFDDIFELLKAQDVDAQSLTLAWDFHTASSKALHGPMLDIRDDALDVVEDQGIQWSIDQIIEMSTDPDEEDLDYHPHIGLEIQATIEVPHYMEPYDSVADAWKLHRDEEGQIHQNGTRQADILVHLPHRALAGDEVGVILYGHGLLGTRWSLHGEHLGEIAEAKGYAMIAVDLVGMSAAEADVAQQAIFDLNHFIALSDRLHQGMLEYILAARTATDQFPELDALVERQVTIDTDHLYYMGASQGGIFGATFMALSPDIERGYLAVPGNNYSTLLHRSTNFEDLNDGMAIAYPDSRDRNLNVAVMNLLWSTTEPVSFLRHIRAEPFGGAEDRRDVLLTVAKGDYQVATITNEILARSGVDIPLMDNYDQDRTPYDVEIATYPHQGSGTVLFDFGNPWPEPGNQPPSDDVGDPHGWLSSVDAALEQLDQFWRSATIIDICDDSPCQFSAP